MEKENPLERLLIANKPVKCSKCGGKLFYLNSGKYQCDSCGEIVLDDFGKVKEFLEENGPASAVTISAVTGVQREIIEMFLKKGRLEIPEGSKYYLQCEKCGSSIRYGRFCPSCVQELAGGIKAVFSEDVGECPKYRLNSERTAKMHFLNRK